MALGIGETFEGSAAQARAGLRAAPAAAALPFASLLEAARREAPPSDGRAPAAPALEAGSAKPVPGGPPAARPASEPGRAPAPRTPRPEATPPAEPPVLHLPSEAAASPPPGGAPEPSVAGGSPAVEAGAEDATEDSETDPDADPRTGEGAAAAVPMPAVPVSAPVRPAEVSAPEIGEPARGPDRPQAVAAEAPQANEAEAADAAAGRPATPPLPATAEATPRAPAADAAALEAIAAAIGGPLPGPPARPGTTGALRPNPTPPARTESAATAAPARTVPEEASAVPAVGAPDPETLAAPEGPSRENIVEEGLFQESAAQDSPARESAPQTTVPAADAPAGQASTAAGPLLPLPEAAAKPAEPAPVLVPPDAAKIVASDGTAGALRAAPPSEAARRTEPAVPIGQVPLTIGLRSLAGSSQFAIRLDPGDLGRIDVTLDIDRERGTVATRLVVERPETLALLQRDAGSLQQALTQAGLDAGSGIALSLRGDGPGSGGTPDQQGGQPRRPPPWAAETAEGAEAAPLRSLRALGNLDIRI